MGVVVLDKGENEVLLLIIIDKMGVSCVVPNHGLDIFNVKFHYKLC